MSYLLVFTLLSMLMKKLEIPLTVIGSVGLIGLMLFATVLDVSRMMHS